MEMQIPGLRELEQRTQIAGAGGVNDDDALVLFELGDDVVPDWPMLGRDHGEARL